MAARRIPFDDGPDPCQCKNLCSRTGSKRGACPCLAVESYCTDLCTCGVDRLECTNKYGHGGALDKILGVRGSSSEDDSEDKNDEIVLLVGQEDGHVHVHLESDDLNQSIQDEANSQFEANGTIDTSWVHQKQGPEPISEGIDMLSGLAVKEHLDILKLIVTNHPEMMKYITKGHGPSPPAPSHQEPLGWCHCGRCMEMPRPEEQKCCRRRIGPCILTTASDVIDTVILNIHVLGVAIHNRNDLFALADDVNENQCLRHTAYRQYVLWRFGHLGGGNRVVIPSCVVMQIRRKFPSPDNQYTGFRVHRLD